MFGNPPLQFSSIIISIQSVYLLKDRDDAVYSEAFHVVAVSVSIKERPLKQWQAFIPPTSKQYLPCVGMQTHTNEGGMKEDPYPVYFWFGVMGGRGVELYTDQHSH